MATKKTDKKEQKTPELAGLPVEKMPKTGNKKTTTKTPEISGLPVQPMPKTNSKDTKKEADAKKVAAKAEKQRLAEARKANKPYARTGLTVMPEGYQDPAIGRTPDRLPVQPMPNPKQPAPDRLPVQPMPQPGKTPELSGLPVMPPEYREPNPKQKQPQPDRLPVQPMPQPKQPQPDRLPVQPMPNPKQPQPDGLPVQPMPRQKGPVADGLPVQPREQASFQNLGTNIPGVDGLFSAPRSSGGIMAQPEPSFQNLGQGTPGLDGLFGGDYNAGQRQEMSLFGQPKPNQQPDTTLPVTPRPDGLPVQPMPRTQEQPDRLPYTGPPGSAGNPIQDMWNNSIETPPSAGVRTPTIAGPAPNNNSNQFAINRYENMQGGDYNAGQLRGAAIEAGINPDTIIRGNQPQPRPDGLPVQPMPRPGDEQPDGLPWTGPPGSPGNPQPEPKQPTPTTPPPQIGDGNAFIVPGSADSRDPNQINVADYAGQIVGDPGAHFSDEMRLSTQVPNIDPNAAGTNLEDRDPMDAGGLRQGAAHASQVDPRQAQGYDPALTQSRIQRDGQATAAQGQVSDGAIIQDTPQIDVNATANGQNALGQALLEYAEQDLNSVDPKATVKGQLEQLQADFTGPNGEPTIPVWAQGAAREISKIAAFQGMTGSAATAAMSQAIMEASLPIATSDAKFFQTLTVENLSNKQQSIINRANILSKFEEINQDSRMAAAIQNTKHFMEMDLANLSNEQQAEIINTQARVQSILEDAKAKNTARMFESESANNMGMFYDQLNTQIEQYNASQSNDMRQFNASLENNREQFYREMQYNVDLANARWRQEVTMQNAQNQFEAAAFDVRNMVDLSNEQLNQIWDRSDALLDYLWKTSENELERDNRLALAAIQAQNNIDLAKYQGKQQDKAGWGSIIGTIAGNFTEQLFSGWF